MDFYVFLQLLHLQGMRFCEFSIVPFPFLQGNACPLGQGLCRIGFTRGQSIPFRPGLICHDITMNVLLKQALNCRTARKQPNRTARNFKAEFTNAPVWDGCLCKSALKPWLNATG